MAFSSMIETLTKSDSIFDKTKFSWETKVNVILILMTLTSAVLFICFLFEGSQIYCVPAKGDVTSFETYSMFFVSSNCKLSSEVSFLVYYPYISIASLLLLYSFHVLWSKFPSVQYKINTFRHICSSVGELDLSFIPSVDSENALLKEFIFTPDNHDKVKSIQLRLERFLLDKSFMVSFYYKKTLCTLFVSIMFLSATIVLALKSSFLESSFGCVIRSSLNKSETMAYVCDMSNALPNYGSMMFNCMCYMGILFHSIIATFRNLKVKFPLKRVSEVEFTDAHKSYPGYLDFIFLFSMLENNISDGGFFIFTIKKVLTFDRNKVNSRIHKFSWSYSESTRPELSIYDLKNICYKILHKIGFFDYSCMNTTSNTHILHILYKMYMKNNTFDLTFTENDLTAALRSELIYEKDYYILLYNARYIKKGQALKNMTHEDWLEFIDSEDFVEQHPILMFTAFCNIYKTKISIISFDEDFFSMINVITPFRCKCDGMIHSYNALNINYCFIHSFYLLKLSKFYFFIQKNSKENSNVFDNEPKLANIKNKNILNNMLLQYSIDMDDAKLKLYQAACNQFDSQTLPADNNSVCDNTHLYSNDRKFTVRFA